MITTGAKLWLGVVGFAVAALVAWQAFSGGEEQGLFVLLGLASAGLVLGVVAVLLRDGEVVRREDVDERPVAAARSAGRSAPGPLPAPWPALGALGVAVTCVGLAAGGVLLYVGLGIVGVVVAEWMVQGWAERATPDPDENLRLRNRLMFPFEIPVLGLVIVAVVLLAFSRVLLALPSEGSTVIAIVVATLIFGAGALVAARPRITTGLVSAVLVLGAVGLLGGGVVGAIAGEREFEEEHGEEEEVEEPRGIEESAQEDAAEAGRGEVRAEGGEITLTATDSTTSFGEERLVVPAGEPVTLTFVNEARTVNHGVAVGDETTGTIGPGEEATIELELEAGEYQYACTVHTGTMRGVLVAQGGAEGGESSEVEGDDGETQPTTGEQSENPDGGTPDGTTEVSEPS